MNIRKLIYKIDSSENTTRFLTLCQVIATAAAFLYSNFKGNLAYEKYTAYLPIVFILSQSIVLFVLIIMVIISRRYTAIKFRLNKDTGVLYDKTTNCRNVSLRDETIKTILDAIADENKIYQAGQKVGSSFYEDFERDCLQKHENYVTEKKVKKWLEYDSSSGMGNFNLKQIVETPSSLYMEIEIFSPFVGDCSGNRSQRCQFLLGYIDGFNERLLSMKIKSKCFHNPNPQSCKVVIQQ